MQYGKCSRKLILCAFQGLIHDYVKDHLGSSRVLVRDDGITSAKYYRYTAYGECKNEMLSINQPNKYMTLSTRQDSGVTLLSHPVLL